MVPVLYRGMWNEKVMRGLHSDKRGARQSEGYVVRVTRSFAFGEFRRVVGKYVQAGHVQTTHHWRGQPVVPNQLA